MAVQECRCDNKTQSKVIYPPIGECGKAECMKWGSEGKLCISIKINTQLILEK